MSLFKAVLLGDSPPPGKQGQLLSWLAESDCEEETTEEEREASAGNKVDAAGCATR